MKMDLRNEHRKTCSVCLAIDLQTLENALGREIAPEEYQNATGEEAERFNEILAGSWASTKYPGEVEKPIKVHPIGKGKTLNPALKKIVKEQAKKGLKSLNNEMLRRYGVK